MRRKNLKHVGLVQIYRNGHACLAPFLLALIYLLIIRQICSRFYFLSLDFGLIRILLVNRSKLYFSFLLFGYSFEKAGSEKIRNRHKNPKMKLKINLSDRCKKWMFIFSEPAEKVTKHEEAIAIIEDYEKIIRSKKKGIIKPHLGKEKLLNDSRTQRDLKIC